MPEVLEGAYGEKLRRAGEFFVKEGRVYQTLKQLARRLSEAGIDYAVLGGMALAEHGFMRVTEDVDILLTSQGLARFTGEALALGYMPAFEGARKSFLDVETRVRVEILTTGEYPGDGKPKPVAFPDPCQASAVIEGVNVITLEKLIELKLASGISAPHRLRDLADVQDLIQHLKLSLDLAQSLDPSVRPAFEERWRAAQEARSEEDLG